MYVVDRNTPEQFTAVTPRMDFCASPSFGYLPEVATPVVGATLSYSSGVAFEISAISSGRIYVQPLPVLSTLGLPTP
jgi:hypothetical protein